MIGFTVSSIINQYLENYITPLGYEITILDGAENLNDTNFGSSNKPALVWFPTNTSFTGVQHVGINPGAERTAIQTIEFHFIGANYDTVWEMVNWFIIAAKDKVYSPQLEFDGNYYDKGNILQNGVGYALRMSILMVIHRYPLRQVKVNEVEKHSKLQGSSELVPP